MFKSNFRFFAPFRINITITLRIFSKQEREGTMATILKEDILRRRNKGNQQQRKGRQDNENNS